MPIDDQVRSYGLGGIHGGTRDVVARPSDSLHGRNSFRTFFSRQGRVLRIRRNAVCSRCVDRMEGTFLSF